MKRVLVDINVLISALVFGGKPATVLQAIEMLGIELVVSDELGAELAETLTDRFGWTPREAAEAGERIFQRACRVAPRLLKGIVRDSADDHVVSAALQGKAAAIVTGDKDLLALGEFRGIATLTPAGFLARLAERPPKP